MAGMNETPSAGRVHIAFFGLRNAGKSTLVNAITGQNVAIVNDRPGTTTDPVSKAMEILPLGPCLLTDTAGLDDDEGELGALRVKRTLEVLATTDVAVWVGGNPTPEFLTECERRKVCVLEYRRGDSVEGLKAKIAALDILDRPRPLLEGLVKAGDRVVCVCPIDSAAPKGRLILPQQQVVRELLDSGATAVVTRETELAASLASLAAPPALVVTDSQAFGPVDRVVPETVPLTSFSILFARAKGDLAAFTEGAAALARLRDGDRVLVSEGCTHRRQCGDIGTVKLPRWVRELTGKKLEFDFTSGGAFPEDLSPYALVIHCGGCMLTRRAVLERIARAKAAGVPIVNYGIAIAKCHGIDIEPGAARVVRARPFVSVLVRASNDAKYLAATLEAIAAQKTDFTFETLVMVDRSDDGTAEILSRFPSVRRVQAPEGEYRPGRTLNALVRAAKGRYCVFNNADAVPADDGWLAALVEPLRSGRADAVYANQLPRPDAAPLVRKDSLRAFGDGKTAAKWDFFFSLASSAASREDLAANPFDEKLRYSEDVEWARRRKGLRIEYVPPAKVFHSHDYTFRELARRFAGEGAADRAILGGKGPSYTRAILGALAETARDFLYPFPRPRDWWAFPAALPRRLVQRLAYCRGRRNSV